MGLLTYVPASEVRREWPTVRPMVEAVRERGKAQWLPEDVYNALLSNQALLHVAHDGDGDLCGCLVTQKKDDWGLPHLFVWVCFHRHADRTIADYWPDLLNVARTLGLSRIRAESPRSYERVLPMKPLYSVFEAEVPDER